MVSKETENVTLGFDTWAKLYLSLILHPTNSEQLAPKKMLLYFDNRYRHWACWSNMMTRIQFLLIWIYMRIGRVSDKCRNFLHLSKRQMQTPYGKVQWPFTFVHKFVSTLHQRASGSSIRLCVSSLWWRVEKNLRRKVKGNWGFPWGSPWLEVVYHISTMGWHIYNIKIGHQLANFDGWGQFLTSWFYIVRKIFWPSASDFDDPSQNLDVCNQQGSLNNKIV